MQITPGSIGKKLPCLPYPRESTVTFALSIRDEESFYNLFFTFLQSFVRENPLDLPADTFITKKVIPNGAVKRFLQKDNLFFPNSSIKQRTIKGD